MLTWVVIAFFVPQAVLSLFGGAFADRFHKKRIMIIAQSLNAVATLAMALQVYSGRVTFADFIYFGVFNGTVIALSFPARQSIIPEIVGEKNVFNAMSMVAASWNLARILGPAMAGLLIAWTADGDKSSFTGVGILYFVIAGLYLLAAISVFLIRGTGDPLHHKAQGGSLIGDIREGFAYVHDRPVVSGLILLGIVPMVFGMCINTLMPAFVQDVLLGGADDLGLLMSVMGSGAIIGSLVMARLSQLNRKGLWLMALCLVWGLLMILTGFVRNMTGIMIILAVMGLLTALYMSMNRGLLQLQVTPAMRGRINSIEVMSGGLLPLGVLPAGHLAETYGPGAAIAMSGGALIVSILLLYGLVPALRGIDRGYPETDTDDQGDSLIAPAGAVVHSD